jgi:hypothetical protein
MMKLMMVGMVVSQLASAQIQASFSEVDITPDSSQVLAGYGTYFLKSSLRMSEGTHDPLMAGVMAVKKNNGKVIALVTFDAVGLSPAFLNRVRLRTRVCGTPEIYLSATHTHHAPDIVGLWGALPGTGRDEKYISKLESTLADTICKGVKKLEPAKIFIASENLAPTSSTSENDALLTHLRVESLEGELLGTLTQWNAHPAMLTLANTMYSADFPGAFRAYMKRKEHGPHLYFSGTLGGTYAEPGLIPTSDIFASSPRSSGENQEKYELMSRQGQHLFEVVSSLQLQPLEGEVVKSGYLDFVVPNENKLFNIAFAFSVLERRPEMPKASQSEKIVTGISYIQIGSLGIATVPGEVFPKVSQSLRLLMNKNGLKQNMVFGITNDWLGYLIHADDYNKKELNYYKTLSVSKQIAGDIMEYFPKLLITYLK